MHNKIFTPASLTPPETLNPPYSWCGHIPFAFWLIDKVRPKVFVELGTHTGNSYFAFCQAASKFSPETKCYAIDTWEGDEHAGFYSDTIYDTVSRHNTDKFTSFSTLLRSTFDDALEKFEDSSIDILHIDGLHTFDAVKHDFESWLPKLSNRGIVLFHDTQIFDRGFGVWKLWEELSNTFPSIEFTHSCGLGVIFTGKDQPESIQWLATLSDKDKSDVTDMFKLIGEGISNKAESEKLRSDLQQQADGIKWLEDQIKTRDKDISWLKNQIETKNQDTIDLQQQIQEIKKSNTDLSAELELTIEKLKLTKEEFFLLNQRISSLTKYALLLIQTRQKLSLTIKTGIKGTPLAPPLIRLKNLLQRAQQIWRSLPNSTQNAHSLNSIIPRRQHVLFSDAHVNWLSQTLKNSELPEIDLSIVTHNSARWIPSFLDTLKELNYPREKLSLYFVDNGSTDNTANLLERFKASSNQAYREISILKQSNLGFGCGHDAAIRKGKNAFVLVTNVDLTFAPDALRNVVQRAYFDDEDIASWELRQKPYEHPKYCDPVTLETNWSSHACILFRRSAYENSGGYEPRIFMYGEDVELSYRLRSLGYKLRYVPSAVVWHYSYSEASEVKPVQFKGSTLANAYLRLRYGNIYDIAAIIPLQLALFLRGGGYSGSRRSIIKNWIKLIKNMPHFLKNRANRESIYFPFRAFDYELTREGAFTKLNELPASCPLVSVVTRSHGENENQLKECIASVLNQTYPNIEHIIVEDDGSHKQDLINSINERYNSRIPVKYYPLEQVGRSAAGNIGLSKANGQFLMFLDEDDLLMPDHVETLMATILNGDSLDAAYSLAWDTHVQEVTVSGTPSYNELIHETSPLFYQEFDRDVLNHHNYFPIQSVLFSRSLFESKGGFDESMTYLEDWDLWKRYARNAEFKFIRKTTSMFHTPYSLQERINRHLTLDAAYEEASNKPITQVS